MTDNVSVSTVLPEAVKDIILVSLNTSSESRRRVAPITAKPSCRLVDPLTTSELLKLTGPDTDSVDPNPTAPTTPNAPLKLTVSDTPNVLCRTVEPVTPNAPPTDKLDDIPTLLLNDVSPLTVNVLVIPTSVSCRVLWQLSNSLAKSSPIGLSPSSNLPFNSSKFVCSNVITYIIIYDIHSEYIAT